MLINRMKDKDFQKKLTSNIEFSVTSLKKIKILIFVSVKQVQQEYRVEMSFENVHYPLCLKCNWVCG